MRRRRGFKRRGFKRRARSKANFSYRTARGGVRL